MASQTALQAWQSALYALIDGAAVHLTAQEYAALRITVELRMARRANEQADRPLVAST